MRVLLSTYGGRGDVEPMVGLAVALRELGAEAVVCAPSDWAERLAQFDVPLVPIGRSVRDLMRRRPPEGGVPRLAAELMAEQFAKLPAVAAGCDVLVAAGLFPVAAGAQSVAEKWGLRYRFAAYCPVFLPSPHWPPHPLPGHPVPAGEADNRVLHDRQVATYGEVFGDPLNSERAALGLPPVSNVRDQVFTDRPFLAADPILAPWREPADLDVVQTGAWFPPDDRPLPVELESFLTAGEAPVYVGFGSMPVAEEVARAAIDAIREHGRRAVVARGWADLASLGDQDDCIVVGDVNQQVLFPRVAAVVHHGGAGTTTTAARAGAAQVVVPQMADQPYFAGRVAELGVGVAHEAPTPTAESLAAALQVALAPATRARAAAVAGTVRATGATDAARMLLD